jgi:hypothetical protein
MSVFGSMIWDRLCVAVFAPKLLWVGYVDAWHALPPWRVAAYECSKYGMKPCKQIGAVRRGVSR